MHKPPLQTHFDMEKQRFYAKLPLEDRYPYLISKTEPNHSTKEIHFSRLYSGSRSFDHYPRLMAISQSWNKDRPKIQTHEIVHLRQRHPDPVSH